MATPSMFLPLMVDQAVQAFMAANLTGVNVGSIGELDTDEDGELVFDPPCARTMYSSTEFGEAADNLQLTYDAVDHAVDIWCADENLASLETQRQASLAVISQLLPVIAGARISLSDGSASEPVRLVRVQAALQGRNGAPVRTVYIVTVIVPGIAQFPGVEGE